MAVTGSLPPRVISRRVEKVAVTPVVSSPMLGDRRGARRRRVTERLRPAIVHLDVDAPTGRSRVRGALPRRRARAHQRPRRRRRHVDHGASGMAAASTGTSSASTRHRGGPGRPRRAGFPVAVLGTATDLEVGAPSDRHRLTAGLRRRAVGHHGGDQRARPPGGGHGRRTAPRHDPDRRVRSRRARPAAHWSTTTAPSSGS